MIIDVLGRIMQGVRAAIEEGHYRNFADANERPPDVPSLTQAIRRDAPWAFLAEVKPASPSAGDLSGGDAGRAVDRLRLYHDYRATGISVLTERDTFQGSLPLLQAAANDPHRTPVLMKDFVVHDDQLDAAQAAGASAVLFIHHLFARNETTWDLDGGIRAAHDRGLEVLLEVDNAAAFEHAAATEADILGINNRDLKTLEMDPDRATNILRHRLHLVPDTPVLALSGVTTRADVEAMMDGGATGVLVGTTLMEADDARGTMRHLRALPHVKLCGTGHADDGAARGAFAAADAIGCVVLAKGAKRERTLDEARAVFADLPPGVERILVTTSTDPVAIADAAEGTGATGVQVHTQTDTTTLGRIRDAIGSGRTLIGLVRVPPAAKGPDIEAAVRHAKDIALHADRILLDAPGDDAGAGGTGTPLDLGATRQIVDDLADLRVVVAGGLDPDNVATVVRDVRPWGVDVSSGIEAERHGPKDADRVNRFLDAARRPRKPLQTTSGGTLRMAGRP